MAAHDTTCIDGRSGRRRRRGRRSIRRRRAGFADGLAFFRNDQFPESRAAFARADRASRDARTQFYIAYSFHREGWHRTHRDDDLYQQGLAAVERAIALAPAGRLIVEDGNLQMHSADELKAELERGLASSVSDLNPLRVFETRK